MSDESKVKPCPQCGIPVDLNVLSKRRSRGSNSELCKDCSDDKPFRTEIRVAHPALGMLRCKPYKGDLDEDWNPIDKKGRLFMPGVRVCGFKDCVNKAHVISIDANVKMQPSVRGT